VVVYEGMNYSRSKEGEVVNSMTKKEEEGRKKEEGKRKKRKKLKIGVAKFVPRKG
jgi:hypothetical protein